MISRWGIIHENHDGLRRELYDWYINLKAITLVFLTIGAFLWVTFHYRPTCRESNHIDVRPATGTIWPLSTAQDTATIDHAGWQSQPNHCFDHTRFVAFPRLVLAQIALHSPPPSMLLVPATLWTSALAAAATQFSLKGS